MLRQNPFQQFRPNPLRLFQIPQKNNAMPLLLTGVGSATVAASAVLVLDDGNGNVYQVVSSFGVIGVEVAAPGTSYHFKLVDQTTAHVWRLDITNGVLGVEDASGGEIALPNITDENDGHVYKLVANNGILGLELVS